MLLEYFPQKTNNIFEYIGILITDSLLEHK